MFIENHSEKNLSLDKVARNENKLSFVWKFQKYFNVLFVAQGRGPSLLYSHFSRGSRARFILQR